MRYLRGSFTCGLLYGKSKSDVSEIVGYVDFDFAGDLDKRKSISGYMFMLNMCIVSWKATLQPIVALSSIEAEFIVATEAVKEAMWLKGILNELWLDHKTIQVFCDNQCALQLIKNPVFHKRTTHLDVKL